MPLEVSFAMFITPTHKTAQTARTAKQQERSEAWSQAVARAGRSGCWTAGVAFCLTGAVQRRILTPMKKRSPAKPNLPLEM
jgi:hypothetical protein